METPTKEALLLAVAKFLHADLRPHVTEARLQFRVLIAAHLCVLVMRDCEAEEAHTLQQLATLGALLQHPPLHQPMDKPQRLALVAQYEAELATKIREGFFDDERLTGLVVPSLKDLLRTELGIANPRFDLGPIQEQTP